MFWCVFARFVHQMAELITEDNVYHEAEPPAGAAAVPQPVGPEGNIQGQVNTTHTNTH